MATLTRQQVVDFASRAGFSGTARDIIVAIAAAESGFKTNARNVNTDANRTVDRGILQINNYWHPEVSDACADDPACAFQAGYRISSGGRNFQPWSTYTNGAYRRYLQPTQGGATTQPGPVSSGGRGVAAFRAALVPNGKFISGWGAGRAGGRTHEGEDLQAPLGSPIYLPEGALVRNNYVDARGGNALYVQLDSGLDVYLAHMTQRSRLQTGSRAARGAVAGYVGMTGDAQGTVPHLHYQVGYGGKWGNPVTVLASWNSPDTTGGVQPADPAAPGGVVVDTVRGVYNDTADIAHDFIVNVPGFEGIALGIDAIEQMPGFIWLQTPQSGLLPNPITSVADAFRSVGLTVQVNTTAAIVRLIIVFLGFLIVAGLIWNATKGEIAGLAGAAIL